VPAGGDRHLELGADAIGRRDEQRIAEAAGGEIEEGAEAAQAGLRAATGGRSGKRLDGLDECGARIDVDSRRAIGLRAGLAVYGVLRVDAL
jgi:hypothetical protein